MESNRFIKTAQKLTDEDLAAVEAHIGRPIPPDLAAHYRVFNGGVPRRRFFMIRGEGVVASVQQFEPMRYARYQGEALFEDTVKSLVSEKKLIPPSLLPFAINEGGDFYCIDVNTQCIYFYAMDTDSPEKAVRLIADSLRGWIDGMVTQREAERMEDAWDDGGED